MKLMLLATGEKVDRYGPMQSEHVLVAFLKHNRDSAMKLCGAAGVDVETLSAKLREPLPAEELAPVSEMLKELLGEEPQARLSQPIKQATQLSRTWATEDGRDSSTTPYFIAALLSTQCNARGVFLALIPQEELEKGVSALKSMDEETRDDDYFLKENMRNVFSQVDRMWPELREEQLREHPKLAEIDKMKDRAYEKNPERYDTWRSLVDRLKTPILKEDQKFTQRCGACLAAAEYAARVRKAPSVEPEHMLLVLLEDGTASSAFLDANHIDRHALRRKVEALLPNYESGPRWPEHSMRLSMSMPDDGTASIEGGLKDWDGKGEPPELKVVRHPERRFSDVLWLASLQKRFDTPAAKLLAEAGLTKEDVMEFYNNGG